MPLPLFCNRVLCFIQDFFILKTVFQGYYMKFIQIILSKEIVINLINAT